MNLENKKFILFDFDGVFVNTNEVGYQIFKIKNKDLTWERFQSYSDGNFHDGVGKAIEEGEHIVSDDFYGQYNKKLVSLTIPEVLYKAVVHLSSSYTLVIVSSTPSSHIIDFLKEENLLQYFKDVLGQDVHKSKVVKIKMILENHNLKPNNTVFITDTLGDIKEANECGVPSIGVTWGLHGREHMEKGNPAVIIDDPEDLIPTIQSMLK